MLVALRETAPEPNWDGMLTHWLLILNRSVRPILPLAAIN